MCEGLGQDLSEYIHKVRISRDGKLSVDFTGIRKT